jgi:hypothetical protein
MTADGIQAAPTIHRDQLTGYESITKSAEEPVLGADYQHLLVVP